jgi:O-antigen/teichoic acid export membrane protein
MSKRSQKISSGVSAILVGTILANIVGIIFQPILVRLLGTVEYGELATVLAVFGIISNIAMLGMQDSIRKHITQYSDSLDQIASFSIFMVSGLGILSVLGGYFVLSLIPVQSFLGSELSTLLILSLPALLTTNLFQGFRSILFGLYSESYGELLKITTKLLYPIIAIALILLGFEIRGVIYALILSSLCAGVLGYFFTRKSVNFSVENLMTGYRESGRELASYGTLLLFSLLFTQLHYQADVLLVRYFEGEAATGIYKGVLVVAQFLWIAPKAVQQTMLHNVSDLFSEGKIKELENITSDLMDYTLVLLVLMGLGLFVLAEPFLTVYYGMEFSAGVLPLQILIFGVLARGLARVINPVLEGAELLKYSVLSSVIASPLNIILNLVLIPKMGISGAAIATSVSYGSLILLYSVFAVYKLDIWPYNLRKWIKVISAGLITVSIALISKMIIDSSIASLAVVPAVASITYSSLLLRCKAVSTQELFELWSKLPLSNFHYSNELFHKLKPMLEKIEG